MNAEAQIQEMIVDDFPEFMKIAQFLYEPLRYVHYQRVNPWVRSQKAFSTILNSRASWSEFNLFIMKQFHLSGAEVKRCSFPRQELVFLPAKKLTQLAKYLGATLFFDEIRKMVTKRERDHIISFLSPEIYQYALRQAPLFRARFLPFDNCGVMGRTLEQRILNAGKFCILTCLADLPKAYQERFQLKFSPADPWIFPEWSEDLEVDSVWNFLERIYRRFVTPVTKEKSEKLLSPSRG